MAEPDDDIQLALENCAEELRKLQAGGSLATSAPDSFKRLADQIEAVIEERRSRERRATPRPGPDRRKGKDDA